MGDLQTYKPDKEKIGDIQIPDRSPRKRKSGAKKGESGAKKGK